MIKQYLLGLSVFVLAFAILTISFMRSASVSYNFVSSTPANVSVTDGEKEKVNYQLPFPGTVLPDSPFWSLKALRDRIWYLITPSPLKKAELALLFSDKRLTASLILFDSKNPSLALSTLSKGEKYLGTAVTEAQIAGNDGYDTSAFLTKLALSSLKHREVIEEQIIPVAPENAKPDIVKIEDYCKNSYKFARDGLNHIGIAVPKDPFDGQ